MKSIQDIAKETRNLLYDLRTGAIQLDREDCSEKFWDLREYLADYHERECLDLILSDISGDACEQLDDIDEYFEPAMQHDTVRLWDWLIRDQSHIRLVEEAIHEHYTVNPAKGHDLYDSIARALWKKEFEIFSAAKAYIMEVYNDQPDEDDEDEDLDDDEE
jgi:hypothetical protein